MVLQYFDTPETPIIGFIQVIIIIYIYIYIYKGKAIPLQAWTAQRVPGGLGPQISRQSAYEGGKVVSPAHRPHLSSPLPGNIHGTRLCRKLSRSQAQYAVGWIVTKKTSMNRYLHQLRQRRPQMKEK